MQCWVWPTGTNYALRNYFLDKLCPPLTIITFCPPLTVISLCPPQTIITLCPPLIGISLSPPLTVITLCPPLTIISLCPPLIGISLCPPLTAITLCPSQTIITLCPPLIGISLCPPLTVITLCPPLTVISLCPPLTIRLCRKNALPPHSHLAVFPFRTGNAFQQYVYFLFPRHLALVFRLTALGSDFPLGVHVFWPLKPRTFMWKTEVSDDPPSLGYKIVNIWPKRCFYKRTNKSRLRCWRKL